MNIIYHDLFDDFLMGICLISWTASYIFAIIRGYVDKTFVFPVAAVMTNVSWELIYSTVFRRESPVGPLAPIWLVFDLALFVQVLRYWPREFPTLGKGAFGLLALGGWLTSLGILFYAEMEGLKYISSAYPQNLMMSILFVHIVVSRTDARGQSFYVALTKMLGTGAAILQIVLSPLTIFEGIEVVTYVGILFFDAVYIAMVYKKLKIFVGNPWKRA